MAIRRETAHVYADLTRQQQSGLLFDPWNRTPAGDRLAECGQVLQPGGYPLLDQANLLIKKVKMGQPLGQQKPMMLPQLAFEGPFQLRALCAQPPSRQSCQLVRVLFPRKPRMQDGLGRHAL